MPLSVPPEKTRHITGWLLTAALALLIAARIYCATIYRVDSDEPQHLHVVWGVSKGLVQYRDIFDNHSPLFQLLCAPLFRALGENAGILIPMRFAMIPFYLGCIGCVYLIGATLFSRRCGALTALALAVNPTFFRTSIEFRPDILWALVWLLLLTVLARMRQPTTRWLLSGFLLGVAFSVSMKTSVMALDIAGAGALTWLVCRRDIGAPTLAGWARAAAPFLAGFAIVPGLLLLHFAAANALPQMFDCMIQHNLIAASQRAHFLGLREIAFMAALALAIGWSLRICRDTADRPLAMRRVFMVCAGALYPVVLFVLWPLVTREDFLALMPAVFLAVIPALLAVLETLPLRSGWVSTVVLAGMFAVEIASSIASLYPWQDRMVFQEQFIANILKLTDKEDYVMDAKGETIFRQRPYYYVLEEMTRWKFKEQILHDDIPEKMAALGVCVAAVNNQRYPERTLGFLKENFMPVAYQLLVAGRVLLPDSPGKPVEFRIAIPSEYALVWQSTPGAALIDGQPYSGPLKLEAGLHTLQITQATGPLAIMWAKAAQRGFRPFYELTEDEHREKHQAIHDNIL